VSIADLPALNATLNGTCAILLITGWILIKRGQIQRHRAVMIAAVCTSALFLTSYLYYHAHVGSVRFTKAGPIRTVYFTVLLTHTILAAAIVPMVLVTLSRGLAAKYDRHRRIARWTMPIWLYVSITGVVVYVMLYRL
jgi:uncharacterized membrane protein YozB (DUF420 family)